ncbi:hypothetical protein J7E28_12330 [Microbacterium sp. ISL-108]|nr:hypothetical protein [Microbacterium sp. ISL-108]
MMQNALGDVEFIVVQLDSDHLSPTVLEALLRQVEAGALRLLDVVVVQRLTVDDYRIAEVDADDFALAGLGLYIPGIVTEDDVRHFVPALPVGALAALILVEPTWSERLSRDLGPHGDRIVSTQPIPAAVANAVLETALRRQ